MKRRTRAIALCLTLSGGVAAWAAAPSEAAGATLTVNVGSTVRPVTHVGAGGLYALATGSQPTLSMLLPLHLNQLTQPPPGVQQLGNGASSPTGDALIVGPNAVSAGAQQYVRMPDIYKDFPYKWVSWSDWEAKVKKIIADRRAATGLTNINGWELWNEPDWTWNTSSAGDFNAGWTRTFQLIRSVDSITPIVGPSYSNYNHARMLAFLQNAKNTNTVPNTIVWHELDDMNWTAFAGHVSDYRAIESSLGITPRPISINEYTSFNQDAIPSVALHWISVFERYGAHDAERAYWHESGTVNGLLYNNKPTAEYWMYKWYGDQTGNIVQTVPTTWLDGVASYDSTRQIVNVIAGGDTGNNSVRITGLSALGSSVKVTVSSVPNSGRLTNVSAPTTVASSTYTVSGGAITVPLNNMDPGMAYQVLVTPSAGPTTSWQQVYEAENASVVNGNRFSSTSASNGGYVGQLDHATDSRDDSFVDFLVNVPCAKTYTMTIRYANGTGATATHGLAYNGGAWTTISYPATSAWGVFGSTVSTTVNLKAGYNMIRLAKGSPGLVAGTGYAELDSIKLS